MITTELYKGQGFGNQLWCYVTTRCLALDRGYDFGIQSPHNFKGADFMNLDFGKQVRNGSGPEGGPPERLPDGIVRYYREQALYHKLNGADIREHDAGLRRIMDATKIDGLLQDERYIAHRKEEIRAWLSIRPEFDCRDFSSENICIVNFRGSGYVYDKELFLPLRYWQNAMKNMRAIRKDMEFIVITEDVATARLFFPNLKVFHFSIGKDYAIVKNAHYLIMSNSSFAWFPAWLSTSLKYCIAPKYWARHNISDGYWSLGYNITTGWVYQDRCGNLFTYEQCKRELEHYMRARGPHIATTTHTPSLVRTLKHELAVLRTLSKEFTLFKTIIKISGITLVRALKYTKNNLSASQKKSAQTNSAQSTATPDQSIPQPNNTGARSRFKEFLVMQSYY